MKFDKATAEELAEALINFSRDGVGHYGQLALKAAKPSPRWNDKKSAEYNDVVFQMNLSMKNAFASIGEYSNHLKKKIEEFTA